VTNLGGSKSTQLEDMSGPVLAKTCCANWRQRGRERLKATAPAWGQRGESAHNRDLADSWFGWCTTAT